MIRRIAKIAAVSLCLASPLYAQTNLTANRTFLLHVPSLTSFSVTTSGVFDMWTTSQTFPIGVTPFDPKIFLYAGVGTGGSLLAYNDDGCSGSLVQCGPAIHFFNSIIDDLTLEVGNYTLEVKSVSFPDAGPYAVRIASNSTFNPEGAAYGTATLIGDNVVPEPSTVALTAAGLLGVAGFARRRRAN